MIYDQFLQVIKLYIQLCIPVKTVRIGRRDPDYITPLVQHLLNKRNKLLRLGSSTAADELACKIKDIIAGNVQTRLRRLADVRVKDLWKAVKITRSGSTCDNSSRTSRLLSDVKNVKKIFASVSFNPSFQEDQLTAFRPIVSNSDEFCPLFAYEVEPMLRKVSKAAPGRDNIPH
jgi:hypothetical protein